MAGGNLRAHRHRRRQSRSRAISRSGPARYPAAAEPPSRLRHRHSRLRRHVACAHGGARRDRPVAAAFGRIEPAGALSRRPRALSRLQVVSGARSATPAWRSASASCASARSAASFARPPLCRDEKKPNSASAAQSTHSARSSAPAARIMAPRPNSSTMARVLPPLAAKPRQPRHVWPAPRRRQRFERRLRAGFAFDPAGILGKFDQAASAFDLHRFARRAHGQRRIEPAGPAGGFDHRNRPAPARPGPATHRSPP